MNPEGLQFTPWDVTIMPFLMRRMLAQGGWVKHSFALYGSYQRRMPLPWDATERVQSACVQYYWS